MSRITRSIAAATLLAFTAAPALAADSPAAEPTPFDQKIEQLFVEIDDNGDGYIDAKEAETDKALSDAFPRIAKDGKLDRQRFIDWYKVYDMPPAEE